MGDGQGQAYALSDNGLLNNPANPEQAGGTISVLCTGEGLVTPAAMTGVLIGPTPPSPVLPVTATIDGENALVAQAYSLSGAIGQFIVEVTVPSDAASDQGATLVITVGNAMSVASISVQGQSDGDDGGDGSDIKTRKTSIVRRAANPLTGPRP